MIRAILVLALFSVALGGVRLKDAHYSIIYEAPVSKNLEHISSTPTKLTSQQMTRSLASTNTLFPRFPLIPLGKFDWDIERKGSPAIIESDGNYDVKEIVISYLIHRRNSVLQIFEDDCKTPVPSSTVEAKKTSAPISSTHDELNVYIDLQSESVKQSPIFTKESTGIGIVSLCVRVDLTSGDSLATSMMFDEQHITVSINLTDDFTIMSAQLEQDDTKNGDAVFVSAGFNVTACQCNSNLGCSVRAVTQGSFVTVCLISGSPLVEISSIRDLELIQGTFALESISNFTADDNTFVTRSVKGSNFVSVFFVRLEIADAFFYRKQLPNVMVEGTCVVTPKGESGYGRAGLRRFGVELQLSYEEVKAYSSGAVSISMAPTILTLLTSLFFLD